MKKEKERRKRNEEKQEKDKTLKSEGNVEHRAERVRQYGKYSQLQIGFLRSLFPYIYIYLYFNL